MSIDITAPSVEYFQKEKKTDQVFLPSNSNNKENANKL